jgi:thiol-disulfide isomerase/thioredoxin
MKRKLVIPIVIFTFFVAGIAAFFVNQASPGSSVTDTTLKESSNYPSQSNQFSYSGKTIAGTVTPYIRYNDADFKKTIGEGKVVYVYFYATWCPLCARERPDIINAFNKLNEPEVVGFEAHWSDGQNTAEDDNLAREYGITSQHTHLFIGKGGRVEKIVGSLNGNLAGKLSNLARV